MPFADTRSIDDFEDADGWAKRYVTPHLRDPSVVDIADYAGSAFCVPFMNKRFCDELIHHAENYPWRTDRHANYPTTDNELKDIGLGSIYDDVLEKYVFKNLIGACTSAHVTSRNYVAETFIVKYEANDGTQLALGPHFDDAAFTVICTLNTEFEGGGTFFLEKQQRVQEKPGIITVHPSIYMDRHAGLPITAGVRYILVSFVRRRHWPQ